MLETRASPAQGVADMSVVEQQPGPCDLCEAARMTPWYHEDDLCWVAECEFCAVPMVVLRQHDASPPETMREVLHAHLSAVVVEHFGYDHWIDDNMRNIPDHYHAHARRRGRTFG